MQKSARFRRKNSCGVNWVHLTGSTITVVNEINKGKKKILTKKKKSKKR